MTKGIKIARFVAFVGIAGWLIYAGWNALNKNIVPPRTPEMILDDTLQMNQGKIKYDIPPEYRIIHFEGKYIAAYIFGDHPDIPGYLKEDMSDYVGIYFTMDEAQKFDAPEDCIPFIHRHYDQIVAAKRKDSL